MSSPVSIAAAEVRPIPRRMWSLVLVLAVSLRVAWLMCIPVMPVSDSLRYDFFARRLAKGLGYTEIDNRPTAYFSIGTSALHSLGYRITGPDTAQRFTAVAILNMVLGVGSVALTMHLGRKWFNPLVGMLAGLILACWPSQIQFTTVVASETPMICVMLAAIAVWYSGRLRILPRALLAGVLFAAASYLRPTALLLPLLLVIVDLVRRERATVETLAVAMFAALAMCACIAPWTVRNYRVCGEFVLISTSSGTNFWMGNNLRTQGGYMDPGPDGRFGGEAARSRVLRAEAWDYIRSDPLAFLTRSLVKAVRLHERESIGVVWNELGIRQRLGFLGSLWQSRAVLGLKLASNVYWWAALILAVAGACCLVVRRGLLSGLLVQPIAIWAYFTAVHAVTVIQDRYHFAAVPMIAILAAVALGKIWMILLARSWSVVNS